MSFTSRHFIGGFLGGFIGIIALHFADFWMMLAASIIGFIIGFWAQEIWRDVRKPLVLPEKFGGSRLAHLNSQSQETLTMVGNKIGWMFSLPQRFYAWANESPSNRADLTSRVMAALWVGSAFWSAHWFTKHYPAERTLEWPWLLAFFTSLVGVIMGIWGSSEDESDRYSRWHNAGFIRYGAVEFFKVAYSGISLTLFCITALGVYVSGLVCFPFVVGIPVLIAQRIATFIISLSTMSARKAHWLGVVATLATTTATAIATRGFLRDQTVMVIALLNGVTSGLISVGAHRLSERLAKLEKFIRFENWDLWKAMRKLPDEAFERFGKPTLELLSRPLEALLS